MLVVIRIGCVVVVMIAMVCVVDVGLMAPVGRTWPRSAIRIHGPAQRCFQSSRMIEVVFRVCGV
jgi:hypothetical protein